MIFGDIFGPSFPDIYLKLGKTSTIGYFTFRKLYCSYGDTVVTSFCGKSERDGAITDALLLTQ